MIHSILFVSPAMLGQPRCFGTRPNDGPTKGVLKMKRIVSSVAALALAAGVGSAASAEPFNGPFVGVPAGWDQDDLGPPSTEVGDVAVSSSQHSFSGGVFAGYHSTVTPTRVISARA